MEKKKPKGKDITQGLPKLKQKRIEASFNKLVEENGEALKKLSKN